MPAAARRGLIAKLLDERDSVSVGELASKFGVTDTSIRHDLTLLQEAGRLQRVRGGAIVNTAVRVAAGMLSRDRENLAEKRRIGQLAASLVHDGDVVMFDSGSTVSQVAIALRGALRGGASVTAVTHSLPVVEEVGRWDRPHLICLGGLYLPEHRALVGPVTVDTLRDLSAEIAFIGCDGLTVEGGLTTPHMLVAEIGRALAARSRRVVAVADASKLGRAGFTPIVGLEAIDVLVTDDGADPEIVAEVRGQGIEVLLASADAGQTANGLHRDGAVVGV